MAEKKVKGKINSNPLEKVLTEDALMARAGRNSFHRGAEYFEDGRVKELNGI